VTGASQAHNTQPGRPSIWASGWAYRFRPGQPQAKGFILEIDRCAAWKTLEFQRRSAYRSPTTQLSRLVLANLRSSSKTEKLGKRLTSVHHIPDFAR
jgi:hypothetical protein